MQKRITESRWRLKRTSSVSSGPLRRHGDARQCGGRRKHGSGGARVTRLAASPAFVGSDPRMSLSPEAHAKLHGYAWPGNVRELRHTLERAWILAGDSPVIDDACVEFGEALL